MRKNYLKRIIIVGAFVIVACTNSFTQKPSAKKAAPVNPAAEREYFVNTLIRIGDPVINALENNELRKRMPVERKDSARSADSHFEAFGRLLSGMAPWLELGPDGTTEGKLRMTYIEKARKCIANAVNPASPDFMNFTNGAGPAVHAAFFAEGLLRAPKQLWEPLDKKTKENIINALKSSRVITHRRYNNWLLFTAMIEAALLKFEGTGDRIRIEYAVKQHIQWYKGDGAYGDGPEFHWDYYNSFVIHPMLLEVLQVLIDADGREEDKKLYADFLKRSRRYAEVQERLISPEATYPPIGRSLAYRFGAFHLLAKVALLNTLPPSLPPSQIRTALYNVVKKQIEVPGTFDDKGWLQIGFYGHQPSVGESYISTGSLYLCTEVFLILGLPENDPFWKDKSMPWTSLKFLQGENLEADKAFREQ